MVHEKVARSERIARQIAALKSAAAEARRAERNARRRAVARAAARAGLDDLGLSFGDLVRKFSGVVERRRGPGFNASSNASPIEQEQNQGHVY